MYLLDLKRRDGFERLHGGNCDLSLLNVASRDVFVAEDEDEAASLNVKCTMY